MANQLGQSQIPSWAQSPSPKPVPTPLATPPSSKKGKEPLITIDPELIKGLTDRAAPGILGHLSLKAYKTTNQPKDKLTETLATWGVSEKYRGDIVHIFKSFPAPVKGGLLALGLAGIATTLSSFIFKNKGPRYLVGGIVFVIAFFGYLFLHKKKVVE
ncbi:MAG TPA: hypothetical protein VF525_03055 [Pyrinomonadaceae bacterium]